MFGVFSFGVFFISKNSTGSPWHTIYIGVGAYENNLGVPDLGDNRGYEYFYQKTGIKINTDALYGNYNDEKIHKTYMNSLKNRYFEIITEDPIQLIKNAIQLSMTHHSCQLMHQLDSIGGWLTQAIHAQPDKTWVCSKTGRCYNEWSILSPEGHFNTLEWLYPLLTQSLVKNKIINGLDIELL
jgi:hypothetical protein